MLYFFFYFSYEEAALQGSTLWALFVMFFQLQSYTNSERKQILKCLIDLLSAPAKGWVRTPLLLKGLLLQLNHTVNPFLLLCKCTAHIGLLIFIVCISSCFYVEVFVLWNIVCIWSVNFWIVHKCKLGRICKQSCSKLDPNLLLSKSSFLCIVFFLSSLIKVLHGI